MPDSLILLMLAGLAITMAVCLNNDAHARGYDEGYDEGYENAEDSYSTTREVSR